MSSSDNQQNQTDAMVALERQARAPLGFVPASNGPEGGDVIKTTQNGAANPDALNVDLDGE